MVYLEDGYSQIEIANYLGLSKSAVSMIIKSGDSTAGVYISTAGVYISTAGVYIQKVYIINGRAKAVYFKFLIHIFQHQLSNSSEIKYIYIYIEKQLNEKNSHIFLF